VFFTNKNVTLSPWGEGKGEGEEEKREKENAPSPLSSPPSTSSGR